MTTSKLKRFAIPTALVVGGVTAGSIFAPLGFAAAQDADSDDTDTTTPESGTPDGSDAEADAEADAKYGADAEDGERRGRHGHRGDRGAKAEVLTEVLGLDAAEIKAGFEEGKTIAEMAEEQNVSVDDVKAALVAAANERIDQAIADGKLDEDEAAEKRAEIEERVDTFITADPADFQGRRGGHGHGSRGHGGRGIGGEVVQEALGLTAAEIREGLSEGKTISDLAEEQGVDVDTLAAQLVDAAVERIDGAVEDGKIDADRAAEMKAELEERIDDALNGELPERGDRSGRRGHRGHSGLRGGAQGDAGAADADIEDASV